MILTINVIGVISLTENKEVDGTKIRQKTLRFLLLDSKKPSPIYKSD